jgi:hypothetical protein
MSLDKPVPADPLPWRELARRENRREIDEHAAVGDQIVVVGAVDRDHRNGHAEPVLARVGDVRFSNRRAVQVPRLDDVVTPPPLVAGIVADGDGPSGLRTRATARQ